MIIEITGDMKRKGKYIQEQGHNDEDDMYHKGEEDRISQVASRGRMENMQRMIIMMDKRIKKLENMIDNMMNLHNDQMEKIISMIGEVQRGSKERGKIEERKVLNYASFDDEYY